MKVKLKVASGDIFLLRILLRRLRRCRTLLLKFVIVLLVLSIVIFSSGCSKTLATVDGISIRQSEVRPYLDFLKKQDPESFPQDEETIKALQIQIVDSLIVIRLLEKYANENNIVVSDDEVENRMKEIINSYPSRSDFDKDLKEKGISKSFLKKEIKAQILREKIFQKVTGDIKIEAEEVKKYYDENKDLLFKVPEKVKLSHILIKFSAEDEKTGSNQEGEGTQKESSKTSTSNTLTREEALEKMEYIESELKNGARFEDLAKKYSDDKISAANGGDIGYVSKSELIKELGDVAFSLNVGEVSDIVETPYGFYILKVTDRKKEYIKDFEEVKDSIEYYLESVEKSKKWEEFIYSLMDKADIKYYIEGATSSTTETGTGTTDTGADVESKGGKTQGQNQE